VEFAVGLAEPNRRRISISTGEYLPQFALAINTTGCVAVCVEYGDVAFEPNRRAGSKPTGVFLEVEIPDRDVAILTGFISDPKNVLAIKLHSETIG
jgi:hypothetical protein